MLIYANIVRLAAVTQSRCSWQLQTDPRMIESLVQLRNAVKSQYDNVLRWLQASGWRTRLRYVWDHMHISRNSSGAMEICPYQDVRKPCHFPKGFEPSD